ncbi:calcium-dependent lipid-binding protein-like [Miscanthus floridulus]|uniref:calcium-dependent lipid-binding protein-like n=1 Tax=Miscanthus floridulus TaxID=154761 RepID=UPI003457EC09
MGLVSGMVAGLLLGVALMAAWSRMMRRRTTKRVAKAADIKILGSLSRDDLKKLCGDNFPEWVSFQQFEQVKWLNKHLSKLWPFIAQAATLVVKESVEPLLDDYRPPGIKSLKFSRFFLGNVPPKIEGIRIQNLQPGQIIMDIDFRWGGDPSIILAVDSIFASLPIQLKDLQVFTVVRTIFQLSEEVPCISAVVVALLAEPKPKIQYTLKAVGGSLTAIPGLSDMIDDTVNSIVTDMLQWPHRIVVPLGVNVDTSEMELKPQGRLAVTVVKATCLVNMEMIGKSDPYVVLYIRPMLKVKTKVVDHNLNPEWNETFHLIVEDKETQEVIFEIYDEDTLQQDKKMGVAKLAVNSLEPENPTEITLNVLQSLDSLKVKDNKGRGTLHLKVVYHPLTREEQVQAMEMEKKAMEERKRLKEAGLIGGTMDALGGAASLVGSGVVGGVGLVGSGIGAVGSGLGKAGKFMGRTVTESFSMHRKRDQQQVMSRSRSQTT